MRLVSQIRSRRLRVNGLCLVRFPAFCIGFEFVLIFYSVDAEADGLRTNAYKKALSVKDEFFHSFLYDWYLSRGFTDQLLEVSHVPIAVSCVYADIRYQIRTPYLESYLSGEPATLEKADLLWQYYVRTASYPLAAQVLATLADSSMYINPLFEPHPSN